MRLAYSGVALASLRVRRIDPSKFSGRLFASISLIILKERFHYPFKVFTDCDFKWGQALFAFAVDINVLAIEEKSEMLSSP